MAEASALRRVLSALLLSLPLLAGAAEAPPAAADPALEARVLRITSELRCLVCQNQTLADSHAGLAEDLRRQVREMLARGASDQEVVDYMTARYGDFVLYRPPVKPSTWFLWFGPPLLLAGGLAALVMVLRRRSKLAPEMFEPDEEAEDGPSGTEPRP